MPLSPSWCVRFLVGTAAWLVVGLATLNASPAPAAESAPPSAAEDGYVPDPAIQRLAETLSALMRVEPERPAPTPRTVLHPGAPAFAQTTAEGDILPDGRTGHLVTVAAPVGTTWELVLEATAPVQVEVLTPESSLRWGEATPTSPLALPQAASLVGGPHLVQIAGPAGGGWGYTVAARLPGAKPLPTPEAKGAALVPETVLTHRLAAYGPWLVRHSLAFPAPATGPWVIALQPPLDGNLLLEVALPDGTVLTPFVLRSGSAIVRLAAQPEAVEVRVRPLTPTTMGTYRLWALPEAQWTDQWPTP